MIGARTNIGKKPHRVSLQNPTAPVRDSDGQPTNGWYDLNPPAVQARIEDATAAAMERVAGGGAVTATATHIVTISFHLEVTNQTRVLYNGRRFNVTSVVDVEMLHTELKLLCVEEVS